ncbi:MAG: hypothetical protein ACR2HS_05165, partial [Gammaproteobacteria bacterium]
NMIISEINYLYSAIINANNKIKKLQKMLIPNKYTKKERKILQIKVDELIKGGEKKKNFYKEKIMRRSKIKTKKTYYPINQQNYLLLSMNNINSNKEIKSHYAKT